MIERAMNQLARQCATRGIGVGEWSRAKIDDDDIAVNENHPLLHRMHTCTVRHRHPRIMMLLAYTES